MIDVDVYDGKYRYIFDKDGARAFRHGKEWRDCTGDGFILALAQDLEEARQERDALAAHVERIRTTWRQYEDSEYCSEDEIKAEEQLYALMEEDPATSLARLKAECWKEAYLAGMEYGHHWTVEGGYVPGDEEAAEDYVADRQAEGDQP